MKSLLLFLMFASSLNFTQETKLSGRYFVDFKNKNLQKDGFIDFNKDSFSLKHSNLLPYSGTIKYNRTLTSLESEFDPNIIIDFKTSEIGKDTISFQVHNRKSGVMNYLDVSVNSGKFIKAR